MNPLYQKVKNIVESGEIGDIRRTNWIITKWWRPQGYYDQSNWRGTWRGEGGGVLLNQAPHQLDLWQWICGMPVKIFSKVRFGYKRNISVEDEVSALVEYENKATGSFITCTHDVMGIDRFEIHGDLGKIIVEDSKKLIIKRLIKTILTSWKLLMLKGRNSIFVVPLSIVPSIIPVLGDLIISF